MKKFLLSLGLLLFCITIYAQDPVNWTFEFQKEGDTKGTIILTAKMDSDWVIYSQHTEDGGPLPTIFDWHESSDFSYVGSVNEISQPIKAFSEMFEIDVTKFKNEAIFEQKVQNIKNGTTIKGSVTFMCCSGNKCLPPKEIRFEVKT